MVVGPASATPGEIVGQFDGLLPTGGADVLPTLYGEDAHETFTPAEPGRDDFEVALTNDAVAADLPLLAICRGVQVLNVARGGSLVQDIPSQRPGAVTHRISDSPTMIAHPVTIAAGSRLQQLIAAGSGVPTSCAVNSRHHQAVNTVGQNLSVVATAPDGVIEAVEDLSRRFCVGVQWHPENFCRSGEFDTLFAGLVRAAAQTPSGRGKAR